MSELEKIAKEEIDQLLKCRELLVTLAELETLECSLMCNVLQLDEFKTCFETTQHSQTLTDSLLHSLSLK
jgi:hypothetical protein